MAAPPRARLRSRSRSLSPAAIAILALLLAVGGFAGLAGPVAATPGGSDCVDPGPDSVTHTFDGARAGVITVDTKLCHPLFVKATTWTMDNPEESAWPQTYAAANGYEVQEVGEYPYEAPAVDTTCVQHDIYASRDQADLDPITDGAVLTGSGQPYEPEFLHDLSSGTSPTYSQGDRSDCSTPPTEVPVEEEPSATPPTCDADGALVVPEDTDQMTWSVSPEYTGEPGSYTVTVAPVGNVVLVGNTGPWTIEVEEQLTGSECEPPSEEPTAEVEQECSVTSAGAAAVQGTLTVTNPSDAEITAVIDFGPEGAETTSELVVPAATDEGPGTATWEYEWSDSVNDAQLFVTVGSVVLLDEVVAVDCEEPVDEEPDSDVRGVVVRPAATGADPDALAFTGFQTGTAIGLAALLVTAGAAIMVATKRRRRQV